ncbi:hypothetical protein LIER_26973 [Lithospermum erythrorhizon]|uniref:Uncharacterized protein n=1 Tax=Lithospermum erythrorhizon TaxID=34254 RepID=A0AAV3RAJ8_LITER
MFKWRVGYASHRVTITRVHASVATTAPWFAGTKVFPVETAVASGVAASALGCVSLYMAKNLPLECFN